MSLRRIANFDSVYIDTNRDERITIYSADIEVCKRPAIYQGATVTATLEQALELWGPGYTYYKVLLPPKTEIRWLDNKRYGSLDYLPRARGKWFLEGTEIVPVIEGGDN